MSAAGEVPRSHRGIERHCPPFREKDRRSPSGADARVSRKSLFVQWKHSIRDACEGAGEGRSAGLADNIRLGTRVASGQSLSDMEGEEFDAVKDEVLIRNETEADADAIAEVTVAAFKTLSISNHTEQFIIAALRSASALTVSLVAEADGRVVGHVAFSPVTISDDCRNWYGLGPVSVLPEYQRRGIGSALVSEGLSRLKALGARGCCLVGHPEYYRRFGFQNVPGLVCEGVPQEVFFALSIDGHVPQGTVEFHEAFKADGRNVGHRVMCRRV